jgi:hypothetical protein
MKMSHIQLIHQSFYFSCGATAQLGPRLPHWSGFEITLRHTTLRRTPLDEGSARCRDLYLKTQTYATGGIGTRNPRKLAAADTYLRQRGHWD